MATIALKSVEKVRSRSKSRISGSRKPLSRSILKFAVEKGRPDVARVKLLLCNNSKHEMEWALKCADNTVTADPMIFGRIKKCASSAVNLMWQRPKTVSRWTDAPQPKMQLFMRLIKSGTEVASAFTKFKAMINPGAECTMTNLPIHEVTFKSEAISQQRATDRSTFSSSSINGAATDRRGFFNDPNTLVWLIAFLFCFLGAVIFQSLSNDDQPFDRHGSDQ
ncbi:unnamed protein product [Litomosoides sigmodontis]|uniref:Uncharacterized protein n=1 Tax=Litomosoides sigmodontis TaxID=42156 RepID=A0A3P6TKT7_LITSI|nr:unnamed protein product [Litomosoides sigmodontis]